MRTIGHRKTGEHRSALEARWAIFFRELGLTWKYEPCQLYAPGRSYTPDFHIAGFGYVEIKPTLQLFIEETAEKIAEIAEANSHTRIYAFCADRVEIGAVAMYKGGKIFAPEPAHIYRLLSHARPNIARVSVEMQDIDIKRAMTVANTTKFDQWKDMKGVLMEVIEGIQRMYENPIPTQTP